MSIENDDSERSKEILAKESALSPMSLQSFSSSRRNIFGNANKRHLSRKTMPIQGPSNVVQRRSGDFDNNFDLGCYLSAYRTMQKIEQKQTMDVIIRSQSEDKPENAPVKFKSRQITSQ